MAQPVDVRSIDAIRRFREQLAEFREDVRHALAAAEMEIRRMGDWLANDQRLYWQAEIRRRREEVSQARSELHRKRTSQMFGQQADLGEQKENLRRATARLEVAEEKLERVRAWVPKLQHAVMEYQGQARPLADMVEGDLQRGLDLLDRMVAALEGYVAIAPPPTAAALLAEARGMTTRPPPAAGPRRVEGDEAAEAVQGEEPAAPAAGPG